MWNAGHDQKHALHSQIFNGSISRCSIFVLLIERPSTDPHWRVDDCDFTRTEDVSGYVPFPFPFLLYVLYKFPFWDWGRRIPLVDKFLFKASSRAFSVQAQ